jgi:hypothetical protein
MSETTAGGVPAVPAAAGTVPDVTRPMPSLAPAAPTRFGKRFALVYVGLLAIFAGAIAAFVILLVAPGHASAHGWSAWKPAKGSPANMTKQIAAHVAGEYKLNKSGAQLVTIVAEAPSVTSGTHKVSISNIAIKTPPKNGKSKGIQLFPSGSIWEDEFCGIGGTQCSIPGKPTTGRGQLVRREALEVALYTFKYVPSVNSVLAFMPPPAGARPMLLFLRKSSFTKQLSQPLAKTLPLARPPLPNEPDPTEKAAIDGITLPALYSYTLQQLQDASALLVLAPFQA